MGCYPTKLQSSRYFDSIATVVISAPADANTFSSEEAAARLLFDQLQPLDLESLDLKHVISANPELRIFCDNYLREVILKVLKVLSNVDSCIQKAYANLPTILEAISAFDEEINNASNGSKRKKFKKIRKIYGDTLSKLKEFKLADDPFAEIDCEELNSRREKLQIMVAELRQRKRDLEERLSSYRSWRKVWDVLFTAAFMAVLVCSVVLAAVGVPPAAVTGATACATAMKAADTWLKSTWDESDKVMGEEEEVVQMMRRAFGFEAHGLETVRLLVDKLRVDVRLVREEVDFALGAEEEALKVGMQKIKTSLVQAETGLAHLKEEALNVGMQKLKKKIVQMETGLAHLKEKVDVCANGAKRATEEFLKAITR